MREENDAQLDFRTFLSDTHLMRGNEFIKRVKRLAKIHDLHCEWHPGLGKGSHGILVYGPRKTVVRNPQDELKTGTLHGMLKQLGIRLEDL